MQIRMLKKDILPEQFEIFYEIMCEQYKKNKDVIIEVLTELSETKEQNYILSTGIYNLITRINYEKILEDFIKLEI